MFTRLLYLVIALLAGVLAAPSAEAARLSLASSPALTQTSAAPARDTRPIGVPRTAEPRALATPSSPASLGTGALRTIVSLVAVLAVIFGIATVFKKFVLKNPSLAVSMNASSRSPAGILEIVGRYPLNRGSSLVLLRLDRRILLLAQNTSTAGRSIVRSGATSLSTLCEITSAEEVASILAKARDDEGESITAKFQSLLSGISDDADPAPHQPPSSHAATPVPDVVVRSTSWPAARGGVA